MKKKQTVAEYITEKIDASGKPQFQIAVECDWGTSVNMITMVKQGKTKVPLERVGLLAGALEIDARDLLRRCMAEYLPDTLKAIEQFHPGLVLTRYEHELVLAHRAVAGDASYSVAIFKSPYTLVEPMGTQGDTCWHERGPHDAAPESHL